MKNWEIWKGSTILNTFIEFLSSILFQDDENCMVWRFTILDTHKGFLHSMVPFMSLNMTDRRRLYQVAYIHRMTHILYLLLYIWRWLPCTKTLSHWYLSYSFSLVCLLLFTQRVLWLAKVSHITYIHRDFIQCTFFMC